MIQEGKCIFISHTKQRVIFSVITPGNTYIVSTEGVVNP
jgi:hypothetical protein